MHIELSWLGCIGDVQLICAFLQALKDMYPKCDIVYNDDIDKGAFVVCEENFNALMDMRMKNMEYLVSSPVQGEHCGAKGIFRNFIAPSKWDYPEMNIEDLAMKAMGMFLDLQWSYEDYEDAPMREVRKEDEKDTYPVCLLNNSKDVFAEVCQRLVIFGNNNTFKDVPTVEFLDKVSGNPHLTMVDPLQFVLRRMPDDEWDKLYESLECEEISTKGVFPKTYLLRWNPTISSFTLKNFRDATTKYPDGFGMNWSVYEWEKAEEGDYFYMLRTGDDKAGIVFRGRFMSDPYEGDDWAGKGKKRYYVDINCYDASKPDGASHITIEELEKFIPDIDWRKGHSGELLSDDDANVLNKLFEEKKN